MESKDTDIVEQFFLDLPIQAVVSNNAWIQVVEPWAGQYVNAIRDGRYGDAVWARYHIAGDVHDGVIGGTTNITVLQSIEEDAAEYRASEPRDYAKAISFYANTSNTDGHKDVIEIILGPDSGNLAHHG